LRLRTACDLEVKNGLRVTRPADYILPTLADLETALPSPISACAQKGLFAKPAITTVTYAPKKAAGKGKEEEDVN
jgi:hypothetical protein